jgi:hypothetical protein
MAVRQAQLMLEEAESEDRYIELCRKNPTNSAARRQCSYTVWPDQSLAESLRSQHSRIVIVHPSCEGGMPHTRAKGVICLPAYFPEPKLATTLRHEQIHLSQRDDPEHWEKRAKAEGWIKMNDREAESEIPREWLNRCRLNPDTLGSRWWAWRGFYVPLPLFTRTDKPDLRDIVVRWYERHSGRLLTSPPSSYTAMYGNVPPAQMEHPFELWAYQHEKPSL